MILIFLCTMLGCSELEKDTSECECSCEPNCEVDGVGLKLWIYSIKDIIKNEELTYDYGFSFDKDYKNYPCRCRAKKCVGFIVNSQSRWRIKKSKKIKSINK